MSHERLSPLVNEILSQEPLIDKGFKLLGVGSEKMVFETQGSERKIFKINTRDIVSKVLAILEKREQKDNRQEQLNIIKQKNETIEIISNVFGKEHVLESRTFKIRIPITRDILLTILKHIKVSDQAIQIANELDENVTIGIDTIAETQPKAKELLDSNKYKTEDFCTPLITEQRFRDAPNVKSSLSQIGDRIDRHFISTFEDQHPDARYQEAIKKILVKIIEFTKKTGQMLDLFGPNNITIFTDENGEVNYHLLDVVLPGRQDSWVKSLNDDPDLRLLRHYYTFYYSISSLAKKLGIEENIVPDDLIYFKDASIPSVW